MNLLYIIVTALCVHGECYPSFEAPALTCVETHWRAEDASPDTPGHWTLHCARDFGEKLQPPPVQGKTYSTVYITHGRGRYFNCTLARTTLHCES